MEDVKISDLVASKQPASSSFDLKGILDAVKTIAEVKKTTASLTQPAQARQQPIPTAQPVQVQAKVEKATNQVIQAYEQRIRELEKLVKQKQETKKVSDNELLNKILGGFQMETDKINAIIDFVIEEKGDLTISETEKLIEKVENLIDFLGYHANLSQLKGVKSSLKVVKVMKGDIKLSELKELVKTLKNFL